MTTGSGTIRFERFEPSPTAHSASCDHGVKKSVDKRSRILIFMDKKRFVEDWDRGTFGIGDPIMRPALSTKSDAWCAHRGKSVLNAASAACRLALALLIRTMPARAFAPLLERPCSLARRYASQDFLRQWPLQHLRPAENGAQ